MNHVIDVHAHYQPKELNTFMGRFGRALVLPQVPWTDAPEHIDERLRLMDDANVRTQILSPGTAHYFTEHDPAREAAEIINDYFSSFAERHPQRLAAFASLPLPHVEASLRELDRALRLPRIIGVTFHCAILDRSIVDLEFEPIYEEMNRRACVLFLHPCRNGICSALINDYQLAEAVGTSIEDGLAAIHMIVRRIPQRYPNIRVIVPHLGGLLPMILNRLDNQLPKVYPDLAESPSCSARRFWYDTVSHGSVAALRCARDAFGADRLLAGSDYPFLLYHESYQRTFRYLDTALDQEEVNRILSLNALDLFNFPKAQ